MRVLVNDGMHKAGKSILEEAGFGVADIRLKGDELISKIPEYDVLVVRSSTKVTNEVIHAGGKGKLKLIGRAGVGVDNINLDAAREMGIPVMNAPRGLMSHAALSRGAPAASSHNARTCVSVADGTVT